MRPADLSTSRITTGFNGRGINWNSRYSAKEIRQPADFPHKFYVFAYCAVAQEQSENFDSETPH